MLPQATAVRTAAAAEAAGASAAMKWGSTAVRAAPVSSGRSATWRRGVGWQASDGFGLGGRLENLQAGVRDTGRSSGLLQRAVQRKACSQPTPRLLSCLCSTAGQRGGIHRCGHTQHRGGDQGRCHRRRHLRGGAHGHYNVGGAVFESTWFLPIILALLVQCTHTHHCPCIPCHSPRRRQSGRGPSRPESNRGRQVVVCGRRHGMPLCIAPCTCCRSQSCRTDGCSAPGLPPLGRTSWCQRLQRGLCLCRSMFGQHPRTLASSDSDESSTAAATAGAAKAGLT